MLDLWKRISQVKGNNPDDVRRRNLLNILLVGVFVAGVVGLIFDAYSLIAGLPDVQENLFLLTVYSVIILGSLTVYFINRRPGPAGAYLFLAFLTVTYMFSDTPQQISAGRSVFFFAIPIIIASLLIHPLSSFLIALLGCGIIIWGASQVGAFPDFTVMMGFFVLALVSWLSSRSLEKALKDLRAINVNLDRLVAERTQALAEALSRERIEAGRSKAILESIADAVIVFDQSGRAIIANPSCQGMLGLPMDKIIGEHIVDLSHAKQLDPASSSVFVNILSQPSRQDAASSHMRWAEKTISVTSAEVFDTENNPIGTVAVFRDYSHEAQLEKMKDTFLAIVSHELRTPLNAVLGYAEMIKEAVYGAVNEKQVRVATRILASTQRLLGIVNDLLDQSQMQAGRMKIHNQPFRPADLIDNVLSETARAADDRGLVLTTQMDTTLPYTLNGDMPRLQQISINLINNAIKFTETGSITYRLLRVDLSHWSIEVKDTGIGIPDAELQQIFDTFYQVDSSLTRKRGGFGLGLSIVKQLSSLMGGDVNVKSQVGSGSVFTVTLPIVQDREFVQADQGVNYGQP